MSTWMYNVIREGKEMSFWLNSKISFFYVRRSLMILIMSMESAT